MREADSARQNGLNKDSAPTAESGKEQPDRKPSESKRKGFLSKLFNSPQKGFCAVCGQEMKPGQIYRGTDGRSCCRTCFLKTTPPHGKGTVYQRYRRLRAVLNDSPPVPMTGKQNAPVVRKNGNEKRQTWKCAVCGHEYVLKPTPYYYKHDGMIYCVQCHRKWEEEQKKRKDREKKELEQKRRIQRKTAFDARQQPEPSAGEKQVLLSASLLTLDNGESGDGTLWARVRDGKTDLHITSYSHSEFSGYHDEDNDYYVTTEAEKPEGWDDENWFESEEWLAKTAVSHDLTESLSLDALYYEGHGQAETTRWKRRIWETDRFTGTLIVYLRRCAEGYRLLRISLKGDTAPFEFNFNESAIRELYSRYANQCYVFEDFLLTEDECAYIEEGLQGREHPVPSRAYYPDGNEIGLIRRNWGFNSEESFLPVKVLGDLLRIRCLNEEDYWVR